MRKEQRDFIFGSMKNLYLGIGVKKHVYALTIEADNDPRDIHLDWKT